MGEAAVLLEEFTGDSALTGDDVRVVVGRDERQAAFLGEALGFGVGLVEAVAEEHHVAAEAAHGVHLDVGRGLGHDDGGLHAEARAGKGAALGMVARGSRDDAAFLGLGRELGYLVVRAAQLEGVHGLEVFALEADPASDTFGELLHVFERGHAGHVIDGREQYLAQIFRGSGLFDGHTVLRCGPKGGAPFIQGRVRPVLRSFSRACAGRKARRGRLPT